jgi:hypothetical protein
VSDSLAVLDTPNHGKPEILGPVKSLDPLHGVISFIAPAFRKQREARKISRRRSTPSSAHHLQRRSLRRLEFRQGLVDRQPRRSGRRGDLLGRLRVVGREPRQPPGVAEILQGLEQLVCELDHAGLCGVEVGRQLGHGLAPSMSCMTWGGPVCGFFDLGHSSADGVTRRAFDLTTYQSLGLEVNAHYAPAAWPPPRPASSAACRPSGR